ncbi:TIGR03619 family F420-dependent LLM class oxidoreductase [Nakamurella sp. A5-74]|uniref:TIGR03619 family F420-dependent LLM class oxidoreductase n=1 Tax=Nakamurella sp. A5-74 TaxID=3158264 RepID=A0AAU8DNC4_9ACTN
MELQVVLPDESPSMGVGTLVELAQAAEDLGFGTAWLPDHILPPGEYGSAFGGVYEPLVTIAHLSAVARRIRFGTSVVVVPLRNPFVLAKQVATVQELSAGRLSLGVGAGWAEPEFAAVGAEFSSRGAVTDDALALLRHLWSGDGAPYTGRRFSYEQGTFAPVPTTPVPIVVGGNSTAALRRAARFGDVWQGLPADVDAFRERRAVLAELARGRTVAAALRISWDGSSPVRAVIEQVDAYREAGADAVAVHFGAVAGTRERMQEFMSAATSG